MPGIDDHTLGKFALVLYVGVMFLAAFWVGFLMLLDVTCTSRLGPYIGVCQQPANARKEP